MHGFAQAPGLAVVLVGTKGDSATYVRMKRKACADLGIQSFSTDLPEQVTEEDLLKVLSLPLFSADLPWKSMSLIYSVT